MRPVGYALLATTVLLASPAVAQDGQAAFNTSCRTCHTVKEGDHRQGPSHFGVVGRKSGQTDFPGYSDSMRQADVTWDAETLDRFIAEPDAVVNGNTMKPYGGITDPDQRKLIVDFLAKQG